MTTKQNVILGIILLVSGIIILSFDVFKSDFVSGLLMGIGVGFIVLAKVIFKKKK